MFYINGKIIAFNQYSPDAAFSFNNKGTEKYVIEHNGKDILYMQVDKNDHLYGWKHGGFTLVLMTNEQLSDDEITRIVDSLVITEYISKPWPERPRKLTPRVLFL